MYLSKHEQRLMKEELISSIKGMQQRGRFIFDYIPTFDRNGVGGNFAVSLGVQVGDSDLMAVVWTPTATHYDDIEECFNTITVHFMNEDGHDCEVIDESNLQTSDQVGGDTFHPVYRFDTGSHLVDFLYEIANGDIEVAEV